MSAAHVAAARAVVLFGAAGVAWLALAALLLVLPSPAGAVAGGGPPGWAGLSLGAALVAVAALARLLPWRRWSRWWPLVLAPVVFAAVALAAVTAGISAYLYPVPFLLVFVWVGAAFPPWTAVGLTPVAAAAYVLPLLAVRPPAYAATAAVVIPVGVVVGEVVARRLHHLEDALRRARRRDALHEVVAEVARRGNTLDPELVLSAVVDAVCTPAVGFDMAWFAREEDGRFEVFHPRNVPLTQQLAGDDGSGSIPARVRDDGETVIVTGEPDIGELAPELAAAGLGIVAGAPVRIDGHVVGVLIAAAGSADDVGPDVGEILELLAAQAGSALANAQRRAGSDAGEPVAVAATRQDTLTGAGNRRQAAELLEGLADGDVLAVVDLDHFRHVNDTFGRQVGDRVLAELAKYLREALREHDTVARYGGEEFLVVLRGAGDDGVRIAERINDGWRRTSRLATLSFGLAVHRGDDDPADTLATAEQALQEAKRAGRDRVHAA